MRRNHVKSVGLPAAFAAMAAIVSLSGCGAPEGADRGIAALDPIAELNFGVISTESNTGLKQGFEPFFEDLEKALGMKVNAHYAPDYAGIVEGMRFGKVHVAWFGNKSGIEAVDRAGGEVFAQTAALDGSPGYWSLIITHKDNPFQTIDKIIAHGNELEFGNGDPNSTSGYLIPSYYLWARKGIDPKTHFKRVVNANHEANCLAVATGQVDFATNNTESLAQFEATQPDMASNIRVVWKSPMIPLDPIVWRVDLPDDVKQKIRKFFLDYGREGPEAERERRVLANMSSGWAPFHESSDRQLLPVREIMVAREIIKREADGNADEARLAKLREKLEIIRKQREQWEAESQPTPRTSE